MSHEKQKTVICETKVKANFVGCSSTGGIKSESDFFVLA